MALTSSGSSQDRSVLIPVLSANDFFHFPSEKSLYASFRDEIMKRIDMKTGEGSTTGCKRLSAECMAGR